MENLTDALKIAFAATIFIMALTIAITMFSQLNTTSKILIASSDITSFYEYEVGNKNSKNRIVGLEAIIPTLYKYKKENYTVLFLQDNGKPLGLYESQKPKEQWGSGGTPNPNAGLIGKYYPPDKSDDNWVCAFDIDEETIRHEPWIGSPEDYKKNLDAFLNGGEFEYTDSSHPNGSYKYDSFIEKYSSRSFKELIGEYTYNVNAKDDDVTIGGVKLDNDLLKGRKKRVIIYQLI